MSETDVSQPIFAAGHNLPPLNNLLDPDFVRAHIDRELDPLKQRAADLIASCQRFAAAYSEITSEEGDAKAAEVLAVCQRFTSKSGRVETAREALKGPVLAASNAIGSYDKGPFAAVIAEVARAAAVIANLSIAYKQKIEQERRAAAKAEADRLAAIAAEKEAQADAGKAPVAEAVEAYQQATQTRKIATSSAADLTRTSGDNVGTTSLRYKRTVTVTEPHLVPREYCAPDLDLLRRAAGTARGPMPKIAGVTIVDEPDLTVRR